MNIFLISYILIFTFACSDGLGSNFQKVNNATAKKSTSKILSAESGDKDCDNFELRIQIKGIDEDSLAELDIIIHDEDRNQVFPKRGLVYLVEHQQYIVELNHPKYFWMRLDIPLEQKKDCSHETVIADFS